MALLIILLGGLLILGGGISLLSGFDIAMTERGSAMTIAGTVALTGGVIAVAIGFSLLRLSQILNVLQTNIEDDAADEQAGVNMPPAVVETMPEPTVTAAKEISAPPRIEADDTILASPLKPRDVIELPKKSGFFRRSSSTSDAGLNSDTGANLGKVAAGLATVGVAGAAILASGAASAGETKTAASPEITPDNVEPLLPELDLTPEVELPADLEAELSRALAEDIPSSDIAETEAVAALSIDEPTVAEPSESVEPSENVEPMSFNEGLAQVLAKPKKRGRKAIPTSDSLPEDELPQITTEEAAIEKSANDDSDFKLLTEPETTSDLEDEINLAAINEVPVNATPSQGDDQLTILGTYNAGDGTYVMYSDGTVEAISEQGVRRFKSMEELRSHLAQQ